MLPKKMCLGLFKGVPIPLFKARLRKTIGKDRDKGSFLFVKLPKKGWASERESPVEALFEAQSYSRRQP